MINKKDLIIAAREYRDAMLESLHEKYGTDRNGEDVDNQTSYIPKISVRKARFRYVTLRRIASFMLIAMVGVGSTLLFSDEVRAQVYHWHRSVHSNEIVYNFQGDGIARNIPKCSLGWIPDGYIEKERYEEDGMFILVLMNGPKRLISVEISSIDSGGVLYIGTGVDNVEKVMINGISADYYPPRHSGDTCNMVWADEEHNAICIVGATLSKEDAIKLAESIVFE